MSAWRWEWIPCEQCPQKGQEAWGRSRWRQEVEPALGPPCCHVVSGASVSSSFPSSGHMKCWRRNGGRQTPFSQDRPRARIRKAQTSKEIHSGQEEGGEAWREGHQCGCSADTLPAACVPSGVRLSCPEVLSYLSLGQQRVLRGHGN